MYSGLTCPTTWIVSRQRINIKLDLRMVIGLGTNSKKTVPVQKSVNWFILQIYAQAVLVKKSGKILSFTPAAFAVN
jgi:hypothetical protein